MIQAEKKYVTEGGAQPNPDEAQRAALAKHFMRPQAVVDKLVAGWDGNNAMAEWELYQPALPDEVADHPDVIAALALMSAQQRAACHATHVGDGRALRN
jgi:hypothetical protein